MRFAQELQLRGYVSVEFKRDSRDGTYRVIEVTPSRTWYPHYLGVAVGVNIPKLWYDDLMGNELPAEVVRPRRERVRWVDEYRDLISAASDWREGKLSLSKWIGSYARVRSFVLFSPRDPLPALFLAARLTISAYNAVVRLLVGK